MRVRLSSVRVFRGIVAVASIFLLSAIASSIAAAEGDVEKRMEELERELQDLKQEVSEQTADVTPPVSTGAPTWNVTDDITFKPGIRLQPRYTYGSTDDHRIFLARFRLKGGGDAYNIFKYYTELKIDGTGLSGSPTAAVENAHLTAKLHEGVNLRIGLGDAPFSRDALTSDSKLLVINRSLIKDAITSQGFADNTIGAMLHGRPFEGRLEYAVGIFQNDRFKEAIMPAGRLVVNLLDPAPADGYGDYKASYIGGGQRLALGMNYAYTGFATATSPPPATVATPDKFSIAAWGVDLFFNTGPFTLQAEYDRFQRSGTITPKVRTDGGLVQAGYVIDGFLDAIGLDCECLPPIEIAARHQWLDDDIVNKRLEWTTVGMNFYLRGHNLKVQADYTFKDEDFVSATVQTGNLVQVQLQLDF